MDGLVDTVKESPMFRERLDRSDDMLIIRGGNDADNMLIMRGDYLRSLYNSLLIMIILRIC